jgi:hypothetical protein
MAKRKQPKSKKNKPKAKRAKAVPGQVGNNYSIGGAPVNGSRAMAAPYPMAPGYPRETRKSSAQLGGNLVRQACSIMDPFCPAAKGAKFPDGRGTRTLPQQLTGYIVMAGGTASAPNNAATALAPGAPYGYSVATGVTGGNFNFGSSWTKYGQSTLFEEKCANYRIVSFGAVVRVVSSVGDTAGSIAFNTLGPEFGAISGDVIPPMSSDYEEQQVFPLATGATYTWVSKPQGSDATEFLKQDGNNTTFHDEDYVTGFTGVCIELRGSKSTTMVEIQYFMNVEAQVKPNNSITALIPPDSAPSPVATLARALMTRGMNAAQPGTTESFERQIIGKATTTVARLTGGPFGSMALALMDALP